jgi:nicotinamide-nucleotide amidase
MSPEPLAVEVVRLLRERGETVATAESLTGGLLCATLVDVPGASDVVVGGVVAYATRVKREVLEVDPDLLAERGPVDPQTAVEMAQGVQGMLHADWGVSTTGVAGPGPSDGHPAGTVFLGFAGPFRHAESEALTLDGDRATVRRRTVEAALSHLVARLGESARPSRR